MSSSLSPVSDLDHAIPTVLELPAEAQEGVSETAEASEASEASAEAKPQVARWFAVQVASSCEKKVKATLEQRAVTLGVDNRKIGRAHV